MARYEPLERFLRNRSDAEIPLTFSEIERIIGRPLPSSAHEHRAWWSNNPSNNVMTKAWLAAGFESERVDIAGERLVFRRRRKNSSRSIGFLDRIRSELAGTVTIPPGVDICEPTGEVWDAERD